MNKYTRIKGLSDVRRLPRIGRVRLGITLLSRDNKSYPAEIPFFLLPTDYGVAEKYGGRFQGQKVEDPRMVGKTARRVAEDMGCNRKNVLDWVEKNGYRLTDELPVMLPVEDIGAVFPQAYKRYGSSAGLKCIGDGETARQGKDEEIKCPCDKLKNDDNPKGDCLTTATLNFVLPDISLGGVFQMTTHAYNSILDINSGIEVARKQSMTQRFPDGRISMVPFKLRRVTTFTHRPDDKGVISKQTHWTVQILSALNMEELSRLRGNIDSLPSVETRLALPGPEDTVVEPDYEAVTDEEIAPTEASGEVVEAEFEDAPAEAPAEVHDEEIGYDKDCEAKLQVIAMAPTLDVLRAAWGKINEETKEGTGYPPELRAKLEQARADKEKALKSPVRA
jgi:ferredoxin-thioredoxin reductase catalytic subunit